MANGLPWFGIQLAVNGIEESLAAQAVADWMEELGLRPHLRNTHVYWDSDLQRLIVRTETQAIDTDSAAAGLAEELFEIIPALFVNVSGIGVRVMNASKVQ
jgi:hypothetical protein